VECNTPQGGDAYEDKYRRQSGPHPRNKGYHACRSAEQQSENGHSGRRGIGIEAAKEVSDASRGCGGALQRTQKAQIAHNERTSQQEQAGGADENDHYEGYRQRKPVRRPSVNTPLHPAGQGIAK
jgi:hypothetical protein